jgi:hypothetical protein
MPADDSLWADHQQHLSPIGPTASEDRPENAVAPPELGAFPLPLVNGKLLTERQVLESKVALAALDAPDDGERAS